MAKIRKRVWKNKSGKHTAYEITYVIDGKQYKKGGYASLIDAQIDLPNVVQEKNTNIKFEKLFDDYIDRHCKIKCKESTIELYKSFKNVHLSKLLNRIAKEITKRDIDTLVINLIDKNINNKTINNIITLIQAVYKHGIENELVSKNPVSSTCKLKQIKPQIHFLNELQMQVFLKTAKEYRPNQYPFFVTAIYTGMRRGELFALEWSDIDFKNAKITVNKQIYRGRTTHTKTDKERKIDIANNLLEVLKEHKKNSTILSKYVFCNLKGQPYIPTCLERDYFRPIINECNKVLDEENQIKKIKFHDLRHTYATFLLSNGIPVKYVQEQLGHSTARMTLDTYASFMPSVKFGAMDLLNKLQKNEPNRTQIEHEKLKH